MKFSKGLFGFFPRNGKVTLPLLLVIFGGLLIGAIISVRVAQEQSENRSRAQANSFPFTVNIIGTIPTGSTVNVVRAPQQVTTARVECFTGAASATVSGTCSLTATPMNYVIFAEVKNASGVYIGTSNVATVTNPFSGNTVLLTINLGAPVAPTLLSVTADNTWLTVTWRDNSNNERDFALYKDGVFTGVTFFPDTTSGQTLTYSCFQNINHGQSFAIAARNAQGVATMSNAIALNCNNTTGTATAKGSISWGTPTDIGGNHPINDPGYKICATGSGFGGSTCLDVVNGAAPQFTLPITGPNASVTFTLISPPNANWVDSNNGHCNTNDCTINENPTRFTFKPINAGYSYTFEWVLFAKPAAPSCTVTVTGSTIAPNQAKQLSINYTGGSGPTGFRSPIWTASAGLTTNIGTWSPSSTSNPATWTAPATFPANATSVSIQARVTDNNPAYGDVYCTTLELQISGAGGPPATPLPPVTGLRYTCNATGDRVTFNWNALTGAANYQMRLDYHPDSWAPCDNTLGCVPGKDPNDQMPPIFPATTWTATILPDNPYWLTIQAIRATETYPYPGQYAATPTFSCSSTGPTATTAPGNPTTTSAPGNPTATTDPNQPTATLVPDPTGGQGSCGCQTDFSCSTGCTFQKRSDSDVTYANPIKCALPGTTQTAPSTQAKKDQWCTRTKRTMGDADGNGKINGTDYYWYRKTVKLQRLNRRVSRNINADFNGDGEVGSVDAVIVLRTRGRMK